MTDGVVDVFKLVVSRVGRPARMVAVGVLALVLLIPLGMVESVVAERHRTYRAVVDDIAGSWSGDQVLAGPMLVVPFSEKIEVTDEYVAPSGEKRSSTRWESRRRRAVILPDVLAIDGVIVPELRRRGIYQVRVFTAELELEAVFQNLEQTIGELCADDRLEAIDWSGAVMAFGLSDPRGVVSVDGIAVDGAGGRARPGTTLTSIVDRGFHVPVAAAGPGSVEIHIPAVIRGSDSLRFLPVGATTRATLRSDWPHPSFVGDVLPTEREITADGFAGSWIIPLLNRSYPQAWVAGEAVDLGEISAGVRLFEPVALYDLVTRATKYGLLFIVLTFLTLGLIEVTTGVKLSIVQLLLIGTALALFFLILIALAEHIGFALAYVLASAAVVSINTVYCAALLTRRPVALVVGGVLTAVYAVLYTILEAEDFALLAGTALLTVALIVTMYFTRRIHRVDEAVLRGKRDWDAAV